MAWPRRPSRDRAPSCTYRRSSPPNPYPVGVLGAAGVREITPITPPSPPGSSPAALGVRWLGVGGRLGSAFTSWQLAFGGQLRIALSLDMLDLRLVIGARPAHDLGADRVTNLTEELLDLLRGPAAIAPAISAMTAMQKMQGMNPSSSSSVARGRGWGTGWGGPPLDVAPSPEASTCDPGCRPRRAAVKSAAVTCGGATASPTREIAWSAACWHSALMSAPDFPSLRAARLRRSTPTRGMDSVWSSSSRNRPASSGRAISMVLERRPPRSNAGSSPSGRFVAPTTRTPRRVETPSISASNWLTSRSPHVPSPRLGARASISSMKMIAGHSPSPARRAA